MQFQPMNELGVLALFSQQADDAGFELVRVQVAFPDLVIRKDDIEYTAELEFRAKNFLKHGHLPFQCDLIICWEDDYPNSPLPVLALSEPGWMQQEIILSSRMERELHYWKNRAMALEKKIEQPQILSDGHNGDFDCSDAALAAVLLEVLAEHDGSWSRKRLMSLSNMRVTRRDYETITRTLVGKELLKERRQGGFYLLPDIKSYEDLFPYLPNLPRQTDNMS